MLHYGYVRINKWMESSFSKKVCVFKGLKLILKVTV